MSYAPRAAGSAPSQLIIRRMLLKPASRSFFISASANGAISASVTAYPGNGLPR